MPYRILLRYLESYSAGVLAGRLAELLAGLVSPAFAQGFEDAVCGLSKEMVDNRSQSG